MGVEVGIVGLLILVADIWAMLHVAQSSAAPLGKALWIVGILVFPVVGFIVWLLVGPRGLR